jgi:hypothetical protein
MKRFNLFGILILFLMVFSRCSDKPALPVANFTIERDTIINDKKVRIEVDKVYINQQNRLHHADEIHLLPGPAIACRYG